jgi:hypothetical protein
VNVLVFAIELPVLKKKGVDEEEEGNNEGGR